jgi:hypothetical protein
MQPCKQQYHMEQFRYICRLDLFLLSISTSNSLSIFFCVQESFELLPGGSSAGDMPPILGKYTSMLFQVQQNSAAISRSPQLHFNGIREPNDAMDQS